MKMQEAIGSLAALAQESRLAVYRLLVEQGPGGMSASEIAQRVGVHNATLSFHLKELSRAGLVLGRQDGRFIYYSANYDAMNALVGFLTENCCGGRSCAPVAAERETRRRTTA